MRLKNAAGKLLDRHLPVQKAEALAQKLLSGPWTHDYPTTPASSAYRSAPKMPDRVMEMMALYPQPVRTQSGGVESFGAVTRLFGTGCPSQPGKSS